MAKNISNSIEKLVEGINKTTEPIEVTLGPKGRWVVMENKFGYPNITNDGVSIIKEINLPDPEEDSGSKLIKEISIKTNEECGDGTTSSAILGKFIIEEGIRFLTAGKEANEITSSLEEAYKVSEEALKEISVFIKTKEEIENVAKISSKDEEIAKLVSDAFSHVGPLGIINISENKKYISELETTHGASVNSGFASPNFVVNKDLGHVEMKNPLILVTDFNLSVAPHVIPAMQLAIENKRPLAIFCNSISGDALNVLVMNNLKGTLQSVVITAPGYGDKKLEKLSDIAVYTGGEFITETAVMSPEKVMPDMLGSCEELKVFKDKTVIIGRNCSNEDLEKRLEKITNMMLKSVDDYERELIQERISFLNATAATIMVGGSTETEINEKRYRIQDALSATKASMEEGIVVGGGKPYLHIYKKLKEKINKENEVGFNIVTNSIEKLIKLLLKNNDYNQNWFEKLLEVETNMGVDLSNEESKNTKLENLMEIGIIEPKKVVRSVLKNSISISKTLLRTKVHITETVEREVGE